MRCGSRITPCACTSPRCVATVSSRTWGASATRAANRRVSTASPAKVKSSSLRRTRSCSGSSSQRSSARRDGSARSSCYAQWAAGVGRATNPQQRLAAATKVFRDLGSDAQVEKTVEGWRLEAYGCPLSAVTAGHPEMCELGKALVEEVVGAQVTECCERGDHPRCGFMLARTE